MLFPLVIKQINMAATIIQKQIPQEFKDKSKVELYQDLEILATHVMRLKETIEDKDAEIKLRDSQLQKQRADILKLKAVIGYQKIEINDLKLESDVEEADFTIVNPDKPTPNFVPTGLTFEEVKGTLPR